jgi:hypothetical protein
MILVERAARTRECVEALQMQAYHAKRSAVLLIEVLAIHE